MLTQMEKQLKFEEVRTSIEHEVVEDHENDWLKFQSWCKTKFMAPASANTRIFGALQNLSTIALAILPTVPVLTSTCNFILQQGCNWGLQESLKEAHYKENDPKEKLLATGEWIILKIAESYKNAIWKLDETGKAFNECNRPPKNCTEWCKWVKAFYLWRYRLDRLRFYHDILKKYCGDVETKLNDAQKAWEMSERKLREEGPKLFDDWSWHFQNCPKDQICVYLSDKNLRDKLEISGPQNTQANRERLTGLVGSERFGLRNLQGPKPAFGYRPDGSPIFAPTQKPPIPMPTHKPPIPPKK